MVSLGVAGLRGATETVLRPEHGDHVDGTGAHHRVHQVSQVIQDAGRVGDNTDALTFQRRPAAAFQPLRTGDDLRRHAQRRCHARCSRSCRSGRDRQSCQAEAGCSQQLSTVEIVHQVNPKPKG